MAQRITRKQLLKQDEFVEAAPDIVDWFEHHKTLLVQIVAGVLIATVAVGAWSLWSNRRDQAAKRELAEGLRHLNPPGTGDLAAPGPRFDEALAAFQRAADAGGRGPVGAVASFYQGATLVRLGRAAEAVPILQETSKADSPALADSARSLLAQALEASGDTDAAAAQLQELARAQGGIFPADVALYRLGELRQREGKSEEARQAWQEILSRFPQGAVASDARVALGGGRPPNQ